MRCVAAKQSQHISNGRNLDWGYLQQKILQGLCNWVIIKYSHLCGCAVPLVVQLLRTVNTDKDSKRKREVIKKVIAYMTLGIDVSRLFSDMVLVSSSIDLQPGGSRVRVVSSLLTLPLRTFAGM